MSYKSGAFSISFMHAHRVEVVITNQTLDAYLRLIYGLLYVLRDARS